MPDQGGERTEQASPKKREDERKKGNIFMSRDITMVISLIVSFYAVGMFITAFLTGLQNVFENTMVRIALVDTLVVEDVFEVAREFLVLFATTALPPMLIIALANVASVGAQTRFLFTSENIKFKMERLNPLKGLQKLFSLKSIVELLKSIVKIIILTWLLYSNVLRTIRLIPAMMDWSIEQAVTYTGEEIMSLVMSTAIAFGAIAAMDFLYQRWDYEKNIRMTKQEVKDEYKQMEGNPEIKSARRQKQREFAERRMMAQVKEADVVVRNPTHYAVALRYTQDMDAAPLVLAKGVDHLALRIVAEAEKYGIPAIEDRPLARGLYELSDIDEAIPNEFFQPVAELLAWLYTQKERKTSK